MEQKWFVFFVINNWKSIVFKYHHIIGKNKVIKIFAEIVKILPILNGQRKRLINLKFIPRKTFEMLGLPLESISISKSGPTLPFSNQY